MDKNFITNIDDTNETTETEKLNRDKFDEICGCLGQEFSESQFTIFKNAINYHKGEERMNVVFFIGNPAIKFYREKTGEIIVDVNTPKEIIEKLKEINIETI